MKTKSRKVLFETDYIRVVELDGWYQAVEPVKSKDNKAVAVLPFKFTKDGVRVLARYELNPAHMTDDKHQMSIITGACETGNQLYHAKQELLEEGGYCIPEDRIKCIGTVRPSKNSCTKMYLYLVNILDSDKQEEPKGDGTENEAKEYVKWVTISEIGKAKDPYVHSILCKIMQMSGNLK